MTRVRTRHLASLFACALLTSPARAVYTQEPAATARGELAKPVLAQPAGRLQGVVRDENGRAVAGVRLRISGPALTEPRTVVTDADGRFEFESLPAGRLALTCEAAGFVPWSRDAVTVAPRQATSIDITMRRAGATTTSIPRPTPPARGDPGGAQTTTGVVPPRPAPEPEPLPSTGGALVIDPAEAPDTPLPSPGPASPEHELLEAIDEYLARMDLGQVAFNAPASMHIDETTQIRLLLSPTMEIQELQEQLQGLPGVLKGAEVKIAPRMEAVLTGEQFRITGITPAVQAVSRQSPTEWRWEVTPAARGAHRLHLALNVFVLDTPRTLRTFEQTIDVDVTLGQQISGFVGANWQWLWTTALVPLAGWLWKRQSARNRQRA